MQIPPVAPVSAHVSAENPTPDHDPAHKANAEPAPPVRPTLQDLIDIDRRLLTMLRMS